MVSDDRLEEVIPAVTVAVRTGEIGDGKIFVYNVTESIRIRKGHRGDTAV